MAAKGEGADSMMRSANSARSSRPVATMVEARTIRTFAGKRCRNSSGIYEGAVCGRCSISE